MTVRVLSIPTSDHAYLRRLNAALEARGVTVESAPPPYLRWPRNILRVRRSLARKPDVLQMHWHVSDNEWVTRWLLSRRLPKVWTVHNVLPHDRMFRDDVAVTLRYLQSVDIAVWHSVRSLEDFRNQLASRGLDSDWSAEDLVIPHISFNGLWDSSALEGVAKRRLGLPTDAFVVGHFGPRASYKGTNKVLDAIDSDRSQETYWLIFGECEDPSLRLRLERSSQDHERLRIFPHRLLDHELPIWFSACNLIVQPYRQVTTSGTIYFAAAFRKPVVAPPFGNIPDVVRPGETGWLANEVPEVLESIGEARKSVDRTRAMGDAFHRLVDEQSRPDRVAGAYVAAYERAIG